MLQQVLTLSVPASTFLDRCFLHSNFWHFAFVLFQFKTAMQKVWLSATMSWSCCSTSWIYKCTRVILGRQVRIHAFLYGLSLPHFSPRGVQSYDWQNSYPASYKTLLEPTWFGWSWTGHYESVSYSSSTTEPISIARSCHLCCLFHTLVSTSAR